MTLFLMGIATAFGLSALAIAILVLRAPLVDDVARSAPRRRTKIKRGIGETPTAHA